MREKERHRQMKSVWVGGWAMAAGAASARRSSALNTDGVDHDGTAQDMGGLRIARFSLQRWRNCVSEYRSWQPRPRRHCDGRVSRRAGGQAGCLTGDDNLAAVTRSTDSLQRYTRRTTARTGFENQAAFSLLACLLASSRPPFFPARAELLAVRSLERPARSFFRCSSMYSMCTSHGRLGGLGGRLLGARPRGA